MWHPRATMLCPTLWLIVTVIAFRAVGAQFYSLSLGTEESYAPHIQGGPSAPAQQPQQPEVRQKVTPLDAMIDKTNHLGFRVLHQHSKGNRNNIAFSPCALASILVALYEGSGGSSAAELHEQLVVPYDKDVLRVGYRDIHRRLRSYFYQKENLLNGLSLSSENITIRPEYESVLKFYGYDLENIPEMRMQTTTPPLPSSTVELETEEITVDSTTDVDGSNTTEPMDAGTTVTTPIESTTTTSPNEETTTEAVDGSGDATTIDTPDATAASEATSAEESTTESGAASGDTSEPPTTVEGETTEPTDGDGSAGGEKRRRNLRKRGQRRGNPDSPQRRRSLRLKRQPEEIDIMSHQRFLQNFLLQEVTTPLPPSLATTAFLSGLGSSERSNPFLQQPDAYRLLDDTIEHNFYLTATDTVKVPYKVYNTILKYAYIERLQSTVIELELDSEDYKLLLVLPDYEFGLGNVLKLLQVGENVPNLRDITSQMSPTWVKTIVPKFNLKGNIILTSDLQNMGINDIFEPSRADFSLMTDDPMIYAKHIEQSININIRTHSLQQLKRFTSLYKNPVELAVNYPFLFCILDNELDLALMVGRILNPLNSRIH